jgi:TrmH family RNA methyltransferase
LKQKYLIIFKSLLLVGIYFFILDMISKSQIKHISSLKQQKFRKEFQEFTVEGEKIVDELLDSDFKVKSIFALNDWINENEDRLLSKKKLFNKISSKELERISSLKTPNKVLAIVEIPNYSLPAKDEFNNLILALDKIRDPGNLGTIIRTAEWYGIKNIICSADTVDVYNPKVIQSTTGSFLRIRIHYCDLSRFLVNDVPKELAIYGALLNGENLYQQSLNEKGIIIIGNESKGISFEIEKLVSHKLFIPAYRTQFPESLNASIATAILCAEFKRKHFI